MHRSRLLLFLAAGLLAASATAPVEAREDGAVRGGVTIHDSGARTGAATDSEAQSSSSLAGSVVDSTGGAIRGARITAHQDGELVGETRSSGDGSYTLALAPGEYLVEVQASGFDLAVRTVQLDAGAEALDFQLELTGLAESVNVTARVEGYVAETATTGTKLDLSRIEVPQSISVVPRDIIEDRVVVHLSDTADNAAGVTSRTSYGGVQNNNYAFRGFSGGFSGVNLRNGFQQFPFLSKTDVANIERVEFLKGPASLLYGTGEVGGLVNTITKKPLAEHRYEIGFTGGGFGQLRPTVDLSGPLNASRTLLFRVNAAYDRGNSYRDLMEHENSFVAPAFTWIPRPGTTVSFEAEWARFDHAFDRGFPIAEIFLDEPASKSYGEQWTRALNEQRVVLLNLTHDFSPDWSFRSGFSRMEADQDINAAGFSFFPLGLDGRTINRDNFVTDEATENDGFQNELYGRFSTGAVDHELIAGVEFARYRFSYTFDIYELGSVDRVDPARGASPGAFSFGFDDDSSASQTGLYLLDQIALTERLKVLLGGRFSYVSSRQRDIASGELLDEQDDQAFIPRAGITYEVLPAGNVYGSFATSFLPNLTGHSGSSARQASGEPLVPTTGRQWEAGWRQELANGRILATVAWFDLRKQNIVVPDPDDPTFTFSIQVGEQHSRGVEVEVAGAVTPSLDVIATYTGMTSEVSEDVREAYLGDRLAGVAPHTASVFLNYRVRDGSLRGVSFGGGAYTTGARMAALPNPDWEVPGTARFDLNFGYERRDWVVDLAIKNLTDSLDFQLGGFRTMMPLPTRHALVSFRYRFGP
ncbi:MAG: TonB-dependent siderophore receptor [Acidobacteria bacterium]|nr:TonB-dependent siderophore receptor [Acidobacteriota bacterium]MYF15133.1 TonB-dependent siderophore receptor [Acidobacteriota bacterium]MYI96353.1 TonB-dependent siderophore receptor [Acidobacteriota bacterium]